MTFQRGAETQGERERERERARALCSHGVGPEKGSFGAERFLPEILAAALPRVLCCLPRLELAGDDGSCPACLYICTNWKLNYFFLFSTCSCSDLGPPILFSVLHLAQTRCAVTPQPTKHGNWPSFFCNQFSFSHFSFILMARSTLLIVSSQHLTPSLRMLFGLNTEGHTELTRQEMSARILERGPTSGVQSEMLYVCKTRGKEGNGESVSKEETCSPPDATCWTLKRLAF